MGLRTPFGYAGYERAMAETAIELLDRFCSGCHTNEDFEGGCKECPIGNMIYACKRYVEEMHIRDPEDVRSWTDDPERQENLVRKFTIEQDAKLRLKAGMMAINPHPLYDAHWIWEEEPSEDPHHSLKMTIGFLEHLSDQSVHPLIIERNERMRMGALMRMHPDDLAEIHNHIM